MDVREEDEPADTRLVGAEARRRELEMLNHIYNEGISAVDGLAMLGQQDQAMAPKRKSDQFHDSPQAHTEFDPSAVMAAVTLGGNTATALKRGGV
jgi:hypothetical protein